MHIPIHISIYTHTYPCITYTRLALNIKAMFKQYHVPVGQSTKLVFTLKFSPEIR